MIYIEKDDVAWLDHAESRIERVVTENVYPARFNDFLLFSDMREACDNVSINYYDMNLIAMGDL